MTRRLSPPPGLCAGRVLVLAPVLAVLFLCASHPALAEAIRVKAQADADAPPVQARQQAQERAFAEAVFQTAQRLLPAPLPGDRAGLLRRFLDPRATSLVLTFQDARQQPAAQPQGAPAAAPMTAPLAVDMEVEVNRAALADLLVRLGLQAGAAHPRVFSLRLLGGVAEQDVAPLDGLLLLQNLTRISTASGRGAVEVSLERVSKGGYFKAVLRQGDKTLVADSSDLETLWLDIWGRYFSARELLPAGGASVIAVSGFARTDDLLEFTRVLASWDDSLREVRLRMADIHPEGSTGSWTALVSNPERFDAHLREYLPSRKLTAER